MYSNSIPRFSNRRPYNPQASAARKPKEIGPYKTLDILAAAVVAYQRNGAYIKENTNLYDESGNVVGFKEANRAIVREILDNGSTDAADKAQAQTIMDHFKGLTFKAISDKPLSDFEMTVLVLMDREEVNSMLDLAVLTSLPKVYDVAMKSEVSTDAKRTNGFASKHIGALDSKIEVAADVVSCQFLRNFDCFVVNGVTKDGNLIFWWSKHETKTGSYIVAGKVKAHKQDRDTNYPSTQLNYVKVR
jgi:hypothetical protein